MPDFQEPKRPLKVGGVVPFSTTDFPGKLAAVIFVQGCPWQCVYCHNPHLQPRTEKNSLPWRDVLFMLERRKGLLDAVVFSGGEPTIDPALESAIQDVKDMGYQVGLHTAGAYPQRLAEILPLLDWVAIDAKAPYSAYESITRIPNSGEPALACAQAIISSGVAHEFRTTIHPDLLSEEVLRTYAHDLATMGVKHYALQIFRDVGNEGSGLTKFSRADYPSAELTREIETLFSSFTVRTA